MATQNSVNLSAAGVVSYNGTGTFTGSPLTLHSPLIGGASNAVVSLGPMTNGQLVIGSTGATPVAATLTAGTGINITNGAGTITVTATGTPSNFPYTVVTGATQALSVNNGYFANAAGGGVAFTLPASSIVGDYIEIDGMASGSGWSIVQGAGQSVQVGANSSTVGAGGSVTSTNNGDCIGMVCSVANLTWVCNGTLQGNLTVV